MINRIMCGISLVLFAGCILPIPHKRVDRTGYDGLVTDAVTGCPVSNACVCVMYSDGTNVTTCTDSEGRCSIADIESWHGAILWGIPMSYSLFPTFINFCFPVRIVVNANGYKMWRWQCLPVLDHLEDNGSPDNVIDYQDVKLMPKKCPPDEVVDCQNVKSTSRKRFKE